MLLLFDSALHVELRHTRVEGVGEMNHPCITTDIRQFVQIWAEKQFDMRKQREEERSQKQSTPDGKIHQDCKYFEFLQRLADSNVTRCSWRKT